MNEANFNIHILDLLREAGIEPEAEAALPGASKKHTGESGRVDFIANVEGYLLVIENKADRSKLILRKDDKGISLTQKATRDYALNGALFYARKILEQSPELKIFAFGCAGDSKHHVIMPLFVSQNLVKELPEIDTFKNFSPGNIEFYYKQAILGEKSPEELELSDILKKARELHNHLRSYGALSNNEKPLVVSAILLALREQAQGFKLEQLTGDDVQTDGEKLYAQLVNSLTRARVSPEVKLNRVLNQFTFIRDHLTLNTKYKFSATEIMTPLKFFAEYINREIYSAIKLGKSPEDYLGRFYGEFVRYSGGDGQTLGVVLTPSHITELFCDLVNLKPDDVIFDPCCGTGGFLIAGMHRMLQNAKSEAQRKLIKQSQIYGIEIRDDMFSIATTNMILRGDGQSNLTCEDFLKADSSNLQLKGITVGFMNPPYSMAQKRQDTGLSELAFTEHLLDSVLKGGRVAVIVPVSTMIGKTKEDKLLKADILKHHTLEGVINLNKDTFYGVGTVPCIAIFTTGEPHQPDKIVKFINFQDDGWEVKKHRGLVETERAKDRKQYMLDCWNGKIKDYPSSFMIETTIEASDEWLHAFYYYNDELPLEQDFITSIADYLTFEANMIFHGRGYLFESGCGRVTRSEAKRVSLDGKSWGEFFISDVAEIISGRGIFDDERLPGLTPYITASAVNNGVSYFLSNTNETLEANCISVNSNGSIGFAFYHPYEALYSGDCKKLRLNVRSRNVSIFIARQITAQKDKYGYSYKMGTDRLKRQKILLPTDSHGQPDYSFMEDFVRYHEQELIRTYREKIQSRLQSISHEVLSLDSRRWAGFRIGDLFTLIPGKGKGANYLVKDSQGISYLGATNRNNAVLDFVKPESKLMQQGNCIAFIRNGEGSMGYSVYKHEDFIATSDITAGYAPFLNMYTGVFITTVADKVRGKYNFNYKRSDARLKNEIIQLPVDDSGQPDWHFMEEFMRAKFDSLYLEYLTHYNNGN
ncbi:MAG: N-6 DNA methylase [Synergistaceae bacterium]|nr:N-6 DNA methylase [Synergistaceae bacterium]